ncbi:winged helix-turn-helix domain-containing protein [Albidovulum sp.]
MTGATARTILRLRLHFAGGGIIGPGKAELLERIERTGSIAAAGREMKMTYRRAWTLIETMNAMFRAPVVESARGGPGVGGAALIPTGREVLRLYRALESGAQRAGAAEIAALERLARPGPPADGDGDGDGG